MGPISQGSPNFFGPRIRGWSERAEKNSFSNKNTTRGNLQEVKKKTKTLLDLVLWSKFWIFRSCDLQHYFFLYGIPCRIQERTSPSLRSEPTPVVFQNRTSFSIGE